MENTARIQPKHIAVRGARVHNLKNVDVKIPRKALNPAGESICDGAAPRNSLIPRGFLKYNEKGQAAVCTL